jgi:REP element-mobilizing transposase RayT
MRDKEKGYVQRKKGIKPKNESMARRYRANQQQTTVLFSTAQQHVVAATLRVAGEHLSATVHCIAVEPTHMHIVLSWTHTRDRLSMSASVKTAVSRQLNESYGKRTWLVKNALRKQVKDREHFDYLLREYLPSHRGLFWIRDEDKA